MGENLGPVLSIWWAAPFAGILLSIAVFPLLAPDFWRRRYPLVAAFWGMALAVPFVLAHGGDAAGALMHTCLSDYAPFVILLWGLFTVSGGLVLRGDLRGSPPTSTALLLAGAILASWIGTTGAAMVMIRPLLRANARRRRKVHTIVFFIFLVANIGGALTPLGDPPLFLGFLHGVPFFWTLRLVVPMALCALVLLPLHLVIDCWTWRREDPSLRAPAAGPRARLSMAGGLNIVFLCGIVGAVLLSGLWKAGAVEILGVHRPVQDLVRDGLILLMGALSLAATPRALRHENEFSWGPMREVAILFAGIFATIIPALLILRAGEQGALGGLVRAVQSPAHYFWAAGALSSFLDNAPTYLTFLSAVLGRFHPGAPEAQAVHALIASRPVYLVAVAAGAVFMGANSYIGNAPNFMVKAIAEEAGIPMPSFFGYIVRWTLPILVPTFILVTLVLFA